MSSSLLSSGPRAKYSFAFVVGAALFTSAAPAAFAKSPRCDAQDGRTIEASAQARLYQVQKGKKPGLYLCATKSRKSTRLYSGRQRPDVYGLNGAYAFAFNNEEPDEDGVGAGVLNTILYVAKAGQSRLSLTSSAGVVLRDLALSKEGVVAALANSEGPQPYGENGPPDTLPLTSSIRVFDSKKVARGGEGNWQTIASAAPGAFLRLAVTPDGKTLIWSQREGSAGSAPFATPAS